jgi:hypothetical protein
MADRLRGQAIVLASCLTPQPRLPLPYPRGRTVIGHGERAPIGRETVPKRNEHSPKSYSNRDCETQAVSPVGSRHLLLLRRSTRGSER